MHDRILVAVDGSDGQPVAMAHALALSAATDATIDVLHVLDRGLSSLFSTTDADTLRERGEEFLADAETQATDADQSVETHLVEGTPHDAILEFADEHGSDLVVMGRHGPTGVRERLLGSVTDKVLRQGSVPVLTTCYDGPTDPDDVAVEKLLVPTDGSDEAEAAGPWAGDLAGRFDAPVDVVNVIDLLVDAGPFDAGGVSQEFIEKLEANGQEATDRVADRIHETDPAVSVSTTVTRGRPHQALSEYVPANDVDLVVMGSHGHSGVGESLLGSVTNRVLRLVDVPVLVVPPRK
ncbi:universal stress protein [Halorientalis brevis]|uniref:Universal stress protein n=1 Tax=Halorientalis brevis TaxID=1126241 RepID=A0ABD6C9Q6_9EURY|nr:universal stress protein [Halorientalis brevis]